MRLSTERILTTHVGSLPRSGEVVELLYKKDGGEPYDRAAFDAAVAAGVADAVAKQVAAGVDIVSDGETSKVGYSTYIKDRLSGFAGHYSRPPHLDLAPYPELREALGRMLGKQSFKRAGCVGPIELVDRDGHADGPREFSRRARRARRRRDRSVHERGVAGRDLGVPIESLLREPRRLRRRDRAAMKPEYDAIVAAGFILQLDCPDLAMARHTGFPGARRSRVSRRAPNIRSKR